jgi:hypothetical protein
MVEEVAGLNSQNGDRGKFKFKGQIQTQSIQNLKNQRFKNWIE